MNPTILRVQKNKDNPYLLLNKTCIHDNNLSMKAMGLHTYLMSLPDDWKIYLSELTKHFKDGKDSISSAIKELEEHGYIVKEKYRNNKGQFKCSYLVYELPIITSNPCKKSTFPVTDFPQRETRHGETASENPQLLINDKLNNNRLNNNQSVSQSLETENFKNIELLESKEENLEEVENQIKEKLEISELKEVYEYDNGILEDIVYNIVDMTSQKGIWVSVKDGNNNKKREFIPKINVKYALSKLTQQHVVYVMDKFKGYTKSIKNKKGFLQSTIYNSVGEYNADGINGAIQIQKEVIG